MIGWIIGVVTWLIGLLTGRKRQTEEELGAKEAENVSLRAGIDTIRAADKAAKVADKEPGDADPDNLDR